MERQSKQRDEILQILSTKNYHPTAEDIYLELKQKYPKTGIATVYRNMDQLLQANLVIKIDVPGEAAHYDGNIKKHFHIQCTECGKIEDVWLNMDPAKKLDFQNQIPHYEITDYNIDFLGICNICKGTKN